MTFLLGIETIAVSFWVDRGRQPSPRSGSAYPGTHNTPVKLRKRTPSLRTLSRSCSFRYAFSTYFST